MNKYEKKVKDNTDLIIKRLIALSSSIEEAKEESDINQDEIAANFKVIDFMLKENELAFVNFTNTEK